MLNFAPMHKKHFLEELNAEQHAAATCTDGPVMILAGAGSGKTRVLTYRIAHLMEKGVDPFRILALTFTNKAAREMKERIAKLVGDAPAKALWMGTFHSIFARILRFEAEKIGFPQNFTIYDTDDAKGLLKDIIKMNNLDDKVYKPSLVLNRISGAKNNLISWQQYCHNDNIQSEDRSSQKPMLGKVFETYQKRLFKAGAMDFDDLLFNTNILLRDFPDVLLKYQDKFQYIMVDEYQDTNFSQYVILKQLAARFENICVVGDDSQSIYGFRGANIHHILNFEKDYPDLKTFKLEQNYRSSKTIVEAANQVIANNKERLKKNVWTENPLGDKIPVIKAPTDNEEGNKVASLIFTTRNEYKSPYIDFAVLYRTNAQSRSLEEALRKRNIPYKIYGGVSFYQRKEIKDLLAYFRLIINNNDDESLRRIINYPARGIGQTTLDKIMVCATDNDVSYFTVLENLNDFKPGISSATVSKINDFVAVIRSFSNQLAYTDAFDLANKIASSSGIVRDLYADKTPEGVSRYENIQELLNGIKEFTEQNRNPQEEELKLDMLQNLPAGDDLFNAGETDDKIRTLDEFMQEISLLTDADKEKDEEEKDTVSLMTVHAAKGLEFPYVFIVGMEENLFPSQMSLHSRADLEEERRLFYVALTRAKVKAFITFAATRYRFGNLLFCEPSRFIDELNEDFIDLQTGVAVDNDFNDAIGDFKNNVSPKFFQKKATPNQNSVKKPSINFKPVTQGATRNADPETIRKIKEGSIVLHEKFGQGKVVFLEGTYPNLKATIEFSSGKKQLLLKFARLNLLAE